MAFLATTFLANSLVGALFMPNLSEFSELIRTGNLDFALVKPIDTQFLISLSRIEWSTMSNFLFGLGLLAFGVVNLDAPPSPVQWLLYILYLLCGVGLLYSLMIALSSISVWLGRNQNIYDFWFYITNFSRYPMEIYEGTIGTPLRLIFTYLIPILVVVNVPARILAQPLASRNWPLAILPCWSQRPAWPPRAGCSFMRLRAIAARVVEGALGTASAHVRSPKMPARDAPSLKSPGSLAGARPHVWNRQPEFSGLTHTLDEQKDRQQHHDQHQDNHDRHPASAERGRRTRAA